MATYGKDVFRYFVAQGIVVEQTTCIYTAEPLNLPLELSSLRTAAAAATTTTAPSNSKSSSTSGLNKAWQYGKYSSSSRSTSNRFCHSFDLSRPMQDSFLQACPPVYLEPGLESVDDQYKNLLDQITTLLVSKQIDRLALYDLGSPSTFGIGSISHARALILFLRQLKVLLRKHSTTCLISIQKDTFGLQRNQIGHLCDAIFQLDCFAETQSQEDLPLELRDFVGVCFVRKLPRVHSLACHAISSRTFGISRDRRKLNIVELHLPPEDNRASSTNTLDF